MTALLPFAVDLQGRRCLVVGGGGVAARRVPSLVAAGALVTLIAPQIDAVLAELGAAGRIEHRARPYLEGDARGFALVLAATGVAAVDRQVARDAGIGEGLVCVAGEPDLGNCRFMAAIERGPLLLALHTGGVAPAVSAALRRQLDAALPAELGDIIDEIGALRGELRRAVDDPRERGRRWAAVVEAGLIDAALGAEGTAAVVRARRILLGNEGHG